MFHYANRAETMLDEVTMLRYAKELLPLAAGREDSLQALSLLVRASFFNGEYYAATEYQEARLRLDSTRASGLAISSTLWPRSTEWLSR